MPRGRKKKKEEPTVEQPDFEAVVEKEDQEASDRPESGIGETTFDMSADEPGVEEAEPNKRQKPKGSKDTFLGRSVVAFVAVLLLAGAGFFAYLGYRVVEEQRDERESIEVLSTRAPEPAPTSATEPEPEAEPEPPAELDKSTVEVVILNGGAPSGTAGTVTSTLVSSGFAKAKADNADGTHAGVTIYHDADSEAAAEAVREALSKTYDEIELMPADSEKQDTTVAPVTVIVAQ